MSLPIAKALLSARRLMAHDRRVLVRSFINPITRKVEDQTALYWKRRYDLAIAKVDRALAELNSRTLASLQDEGTP